MADRKSKRESPVGSSSITDGPPVPLPVPNSPDWTKLPVRDQIEYQRIELMQIHAALECLAEVLLYSDDDDGTMHSDVAKICGRLINTVVANLESILNRIPDDPVPESASGEGGADE